MKNIILFLVIICLFSCSSKTDPNVSELFNLKLNNTQTWSASDYKEEYDSRDSEVNNVEEGKQPLTEEGVSDAIIGIYDQISSGIIESPVEQLSDEFRSLEKRAREFDPMAVDWNYWVMAQECENLALRTISVESFNNTTAVAVVHLENMGERTDIKLWLVYEDDIWKVSDFLDINNSDTTIATIFRNIIQQGE